MTDAHLMPSSTASPGYAQHATRTAPVDAALPELENATLPAILDTPVFPQLRHVLLVAHSVPRAQRTEPVCAMDKAPAPA